MQKFVPRSRVSIFRDEPTRSTPLFAKLMFWRISYRLVVFATIWLPYETRGKTFRTSAKVRATKSRRTFPQQKHPIHPMGPKLNFWCISNHLDPFGTVRLPYQTQGKTGRTSAKVRATKSQQNLPQRKHPIHPMGA